MALRTAMGDPEIRRFAVVGSPIGHSLSPVLHRAAYLTLGVEDAEYGSAEVGEGELSAFVSAGDGVALSGLSVTMPGKPEAFELATEHDPTSARLRIANTLIRRPRGGWRAENHDVHGIVASFADHGATRIGRGGVVGSGATALSAADALCEMGAREVLLTARTPQRLDPIAQHLRARGVEAVLVPWEESHRILSAEVVVTALAAEGAALVREQWLERGLATTPGLLLDVLYEPWPSPIAALVRDVGGTSISGLEMLVHQARRQVRSMLGVRDVPAAPMMRAALAELDRRSRSAAGGPI